MKANTPLKAITIDAPWAWAIIAGHKQVENRTWRTKHRGPLAIHAGLNKRSDEVTAQLFDELSLAAPRDGDLDALRGRLLGVVDIVDMWPDDPRDGKRDGEQKRSTKDAANRFGPWWIGPVGWELANPRTLKDPPLVTGKQGLWNVDEGLVARLGR